MTAIIEVRSYTRSGSPSLKDSMNARRTRIIAFVAVPTLLLLLPLVVYFVDQTANHGEVPRNVSVAGVDVGGLSPDDATVVVRAYESNLQGQQATFVISGSTYELDPTTVGLTADVEAAVTEAFNQRTGGLISGFVPWLNGFTERVDIDLVISVDDDAIDAQLDHWELNAIENPAYEGAIDVVDGDIEFHYPQIGEKIDKPAAHTIVSTLLTQAERKTTELPLIDSVPVMTQADVDDAVTTLRMMVSRPVLLYDEDRNLVLTVKPSDISDATIVEIVHNTPPQIDISLSVDRVAELLGAHREQFELPPVDADFEVDIETEKVTIIPSKNATVLDAEGVAVELLRAATSRTARGSLVYVEGEEPEFTTADAEALGPIELVSEFTTKTPGVNRVHNIHLMADTIDGSIIWPGEEFSVNEVIGPRTEAKGYKRDGAIIGGEVTCCDEPANVGGGVSQYATTIYNAVFFGCYEDIDHTPHSIYISRYPEGREATMGFPGPDVVFRNDSDVPIIIRNSYDDNSTITVQFYGNNGGRTCESERSGRFNYTAPRVLYKDNRAVTPGSEHLASKGSQGWSVTVTRVMTMPDGTVIREPYTHHYRGRARIIEKHPCNLGMEACPVTTTTTTTLVAPDTTVPTTTTPPPVEG